MNANTMSLLLWLLLLVAGQQHLANAMKMDECTVGLFRLPMRIQPSNYELNVRLNPEEELFSGKVTINLGIKGTMDSKAFMLTRTIGDHLSPMVQDPKNIILNAEGLVVKDPVFYQEGSGEIQASICHDEANKILVVILSEEPIPNVATQLTLKFEGQVRKDTSGLFRSSINRNNWMLATHLEPAYARRLFPCFDEPEFKATFMLKITHPPGTIALSNMQISGNGFDSDGFSITEYAPTPKMSTFLLGLVVGNFDRTTLNSPTYNMPITIYAPRGSEPHISASAMHQKALQAYDYVNKFFEGIPLELKKIDIVAVELEHAAAMESLGLITMRWELLSAHEELSKPDDWNYAVVAMMNQMVRFWLGNLVTVRWWNDLWLIEGLANYLASELTFDLHPRINSDLYTLIETTFSAMEDDDDPQKSHPIKRLDLRTVDEIRKSYDSITYKKSEAIFRMFDQFLGENESGEEIFRLAILDFVVSYAYNVVDDDEWWVTLSKYASNDIDMLMMGHQWTYQAGYPIITAYMEAGQRLRLSQRSSKNNEQTWIVPVSCILHKPPKGKVREYLSFVLSGITNVFDLPTHIKSQNWLKLNVLYKGYYRVEYLSYTDSLMGPLNRALEGNRVKPADRLQLLSDFYAMYKKTWSVEKLKNFENLLDCFSKPGEKDDGVMLLLTRILGELHFHQKPLPSRDLIGKMMKHYYTEKGYLKPADSYVLRQCARGQVVEYLVYALKDKEVIEEARKLKLETGGNPPPFLEHVLTNLS